MPLFLPRMLSSFLPPLLPSSISALLPRGTPGPLFNYPHLSLTCKCLPGTRPPAGAALPLTSSKKNLVIAMFAPHIALTHVIT